MGLFDTVIICCPHCDQYVKTQTKDGPCMLDEVMLNESPLLTCASEGDHVCKYCKGVFEVVLVTKPIAMVRKK